MNRDESRYEYGLAKMREIFGSDVETAVNALATTSPDLARFLVEFPFGDIYSRPTLNTKTREMLTVAALTVLGYPGVGSPLGFLFGGGRVCHQATKQGVACLREPNQHDERPFELGQNWTSQSAGYTHSPGMSA